MPAPDATREYLDEQTAATVTVSREPLVFALERLDLGVHVRDYLTLVLVDVNRAGTHAQYFYGYAWSTVDKRRAGQGTLEPPQFQLVADGRLIPLVPLEVSPREVGIGEPPLQAPASGATIIVSPTTRELQEFVWDAETIVVIARRGAIAERFALWDR